MWFDAGSGHYVVSDEVGGAIGGGDDWWKCDTAATPLDDYTAQGTATGNMTETHVPNATPTIEKL